MAKGVRGSGSGKKTSNFQFKKRCCNGDGKRAKYQGLDGKYYCKFCWRDLDKI